MSSISADSYVCIWLCSIGVSEDGFSIHHTIPFTSKVRSDHNNKFYRLKWFEYHEMMNYRNWYIKVE